MKYYLIVNVDGEVTYASLTKELRDNIYNYAQNTHNDVEMSKYYKKIDFDPHKWIAFPKNW